MSSELLKLQPLPGRAAVVCNPDTPRVKQVVSALAKLGAASPKLISYEDLLDGSIDLSRVIEAGAVVRLEAPGKHFQTELKLIALGESGSEVEGSYRVSKQKLAELATQPEAGEIIAPRQWYHGWRHLLDRISVQLANAPLHVLMNYPTDVALMFDKPTCHQALELLQLPQPRCFGIVRSYEELRELIRRECCKRLFLKIANGSSASGIVAYQTDGRIRHLATTSVELSEAGLHAGPSGGTRLYNSRRIRVYDDERTIARLVDALGGHWLHVEEWLPKANIHGKNFDLRVVVINRKVSHSAARLSRSPMTNLHLLNERMDGSEIRKIIPERTWTEIVRSCERAMSEQFPRTLYAGFDVLVDRTMRKHAIAEVNAFGDHLNGILHEGRSTHEVEYLDAFETDRDNRSERPAEIMP